MQGYKRINENNFILNSDSYKECHWEQYPVGTRKIYSYLESRGGKFERVLFFGLQYILKKHLVGKVLSKGMINEAEDVLGSHFKNNKLFNRKGFERLWKKHKETLPLKIRAVPEGSIVPVGNVLMTIENTDPEFYWLTDFMETIISQVWYPATVATYSMEAKKIISRYFKKTSDASLELIDYMLHDFGFRGCSSWETSGVGGMAHLINFKGTDTLSAIVFGRNYYDSEMAGYSVPASQHSTMTIRGKRGEMETYSKMLDIYPTGIVSVVSDSYDIINAVGNIWGGALRSKVLTRNGKVVIRPDSGDPVEVDRKVMNILWEKFGGKINEKGYKVLDSHVGIIQGDGVDLATIDKVLEMMEVEHFSAENIVFGSGGALLQKHNRDDCKFAIKCSYAEVGGEPIDVQKNPITDPGKKSKAGRLALVRNGQQYITKRREELKETETDVLETVFENGKLVKERNFEEVRKLAETNLAELAALGVN